MKQLQILSLLSLIFVLGWTADAQAMSCGGGGGGAVPGVTAAASCATSVYFTIDLDALDVGVDTSGSATVGTMGEIILPITGGNASGTPLAGHFEHNGSGIQFEFDSVDVDVEDLDFDFDAAQVDGDLSAGPIELSTGIFNLVACNGTNCIGPGGSSPMNGYGLFLRAQAADFFENVVFQGDGFDDGDQIAWATSNCPPVPEPMLLTLLGLGLATLGTVRRSTV